MITSNKILILFLFFLLLLVPSDSYAFYNKPYEIEIITKRDTYNLGEEAQFIITIKKGKHYANLKAFDIEATFPEDTTKITLQKTNKGNLIYSEVLTRELEKQTLKIRLYKKNRIKIIDLLNDSQKAKKFGENGYKIAKQSKVSHTE